MRLVASRHTSATYRARSATPLGAMFAWGLAAMASLALTACSGGINPDVASTQSAPVADVDSSRAPPQTVTSMPLLPPVPEKAATTPAVGEVLPSTGDAQQTPLPYERLYSDDEQARIQSELTAAAAKAKGD